LVGIALRSTELQHKDQRRREPAVGN